MNKHLARKLAKKALKAQKDPEHISEEEIEKTLFTLFIIATLKHFFRIPLKTSLEKSVRLVLNRLDTVVHPHSVFRPRDNA